MKTKIYSKKKLISLLRKWVSKHGEVPSKRQLKEDLTMPSDFTYRRFFGSYKTAVINAGFKPKTTGGFSEQARIACIKAHKGKRSMGWKGGKRVDNYGYVQIWNPDHPNSKMSGYIHEHRLIMSNHLKRPLLKNESVHHKNGNREDNRIENLELWNSVQPSGQRVIDKIKYAKEILRIYENPELLTNP